MAFDMEFSAPESIKRASTPNGWIRLAAAGAGLATLLILLALISTLATADEGISEFFLLISPLPLALTMPALYRLHRAAAPVTSLVALLCGGASIVGPLVAGLFYLLFERDGTAISMGLLALFGLWGILNAGIALRHGTLPVAVASLGIIAGVSWMFAMGSAVLNMYNPAAMHTIHYVLSINIMVLFTIYPLWAAWLGFALWRTGDSE